MKDYSITGRNEGRMLNPFVDWAFKYMFAREESKSITMGFLNLIINPDPKIVHLEFLPNEAIPDSDEMKRSVFDVLCKDAAGDRFLVEMQCAENANFENRMIYYTCRLVDQMGKHDSSWDYDIQKVYTICLMDYTCGSNPILRSDIALYNLSKREVFSDRINIIMFQIPCVKARTIDEATEIYEKMLYLLVSMKEGNKSLEELKMEVAQTNSLEEYTRKLFLELAQVADYASLNDVERAAYDAKLKVARDNNSCLKFARTSGYKAGMTEGIAIGEEKGREEERKKMLAEIRKDKIESARQMKQDGLPIAVILKYTGLTKKEIEQL